MHFARSVIVSRRSVEGDGRRRVALACAALARGGGLACRPRALCRGAAALGDAAALPRWRGVHALAAPRPAGLLRAAGLLVDRGPGAPRCLPLREASLFVAPLDVLRLPLLLLRVPALVSAWHVNTSGVQACDSPRRRQEGPRRGGVSPMPRTPTTPRLRRDRVRQKLAR